MFINILMSLFISNAENAQIRVAVIDTGYTYSNVFNANLCKTDHKDFTEDQVYEKNVPVDFNGHGSNVAGLIHEYATGYTLSNNKLFNIDKLKENKANYCLVIIKAFSKDAKIKSYLDALEYVSKLKNIDIVNISAGGKQSDDQEKNIIRKMLNDHKIIIAAAGNNGENVDINNYYPALIDNRIIVVGNSVSEETKETNNIKYSKDDYYKIFKKSETSNYGASVDVFAPGTNMLSLSLNPNELAYLTGTSQATASFTGIIVNNILNKKVRKNEINSK